MPPVPSHELFTLKGEGCSRTQVQHVQTTAELAMVKALQFASSTDVEDVEGILPSPKLSGLDQNFLDSGHVPQMFCLGFKHPRNKTTSGPILEASRRPLFFPPSRFPKRGRVLAASRSGWRLIHRCDAHQMRWDLGARSLPTRMASAWSADVDGRRREVGSMVCCSLSIDVVFSTSMNREGMVFMQ